MKTYVIIIILLKTKQKKVRINKRKKFSVQKKNGCYVKISLLLPVSTTHQQKVIKKIDKNKITFDGCPFFSPSKQ